MHPHTKWSEPKITRLRKASWHIANLHGSFGPYQVGAFLLFDLWKRVDSGGNNDDLATEHADMGR